MEVCKVLMTVCDTVTYFAEEELSMVTIENFSEHGRALLEQLPAEARLPMIRVALIYKHEIESEDPPFYIDEEDDDLEDDPIAEEDEAEGEGEGEGEDDDDDDDEEDETMRPEHFFEFKRFFTEEEAAALVEGAEEGGALAKAVDATLDSLVAADEEEAKAEEDDEEEDEDEEDDEEDDDDHMLDPEYVKWKGA
jgi:hypothetical protein